MKYLSPKDIAEQLGVSRAKVYRLIKSLPRVHIGTCVRVAHAVITFYLAWFLSLLCTTPTAWVEQRDDGTWFAACGDENGDPL